MSTTNIWKNEKGNIGIPFEIKYCFFVHNLMKSYFFNSAFLVGPVQKRVHIPGFSSLIKLCF